MLISIIVLVLGLWYGVNQRAHHLEGGGVRRESKGIYGPEKFALTTFLPPGRGGGGEKN